MSSDDLERIRAKTYWADKRILELKSELSTLYTSREPLHKSATRVIFE